MEDEIEIDNLDFHEQIGEGGYGTVHRMTFKKPYKGYTEAAAKSVKSLRKEEVQIMRNLCHPNIVVFIGFYLNGPLNVILMEYTRDGSLHDYLSDQSKVLQEDLMLKWAKEAALATHYLHANNYLHRDIKSKNCLLFKGNTLKLCDFGLAREIEVSFTLSSEKGTFKFMAPEIIVTNDKNQGQFSRYTDIYAYGMLLLEITSRKPPFDGMEYAYVVFHVGNGSLKPTIPSDCPKVLADLMESCWKTAPRERPSIERIVEALSTQEIHPHSQLHPQHDEGRLDEEAKCEVPSEWSLKQTMFPVQKNPKPNPNPMTMNMVQRLRCCPNGDMVVAVYRESEINILHGHNGEFKIARLTSPEEDKEKQIGRIRNIDVSSEGHIVIVDGTRYVKVFDENGKYLHCVSAVSSNEEDTKSQAINLRCVTTDGKGNVLMLDRENNLIKIQLCINGKIESKVKCRNLEPSGRITVNSKNHVIYHFNRFAAVNTKLLSLDDEGNEIFSVSTRIDEELEDGKKVWAEGVVCDAKDNIYIALKVLKGYNEIPNTGHIHKHSPKGTFLECIARSLFSPWDLSIRGDGSLVVANNHSILIYGSNQLSST